MADNIGAWFWEKNTDVNFSLICFQDILGLSKRGLIVLANEWITYCDYLCTARRTRDTFHTDTGCQVTQLTLEKWNTRRLVLHWRPCAPLTQTLWDNPEIPSAVWVSHENQARPSLNFREYVFNLHNLFTFTDCLSSSDFAFNPPQKSHHPSKCLFS